MKKILALLGSMGLVATSAMSVVACFGQNEQINQHQEISTLARERAKSLIIADQFGLDHQQVFNHLQNLTNAQTTSRYNEIFNETSINAFNINGKVGATGGILNQIINDNFQITDQTILDLIARMTNNSDNQAEKDRIKNTTGAEQISIILNTLATSVDSILGAGLGSVVGTVSGILPGFINADLISQITNISGKIKDVITNISQTSVQSILRALKNGSDLTTLQYYYEVLDENRFFTVAQMQAQMAFSLVNFFGYGIEKDYKEFVTINPSSPNTINYEGVSAKLFEFIKSGKISKFDFNLNLEKTVENLVRFVTILNTLLSLYRTPEIVYSSTGDYSQHLFSETETNDQFMTAINRKRIDTLNINLKGFNFGELIANLQYYLGGDQETGQYHFQKLIYILLSDGTFVGNSSLINLLLAGVAQVELGITNKTEVDSLRSIIGGNVIKRIVNNQRLRLKSIIDGKLWEVIAPSLGENAEQIKNLLLSVETAFGENSFSTLYSGNIRTIINAVQDIMPSDIKTQINNSLTQLFGKEIPNLENLLTRISIKKFLSIFGIAGFENSNIPSMFDHYLNQSINQLVNELGTTFEIKMNDTNAKLLDYNLDFQIFEQVINELLYAVNGQETGLITQILDVLDTNDVKGTLTKVYEILGYVNFDNGIVKADSFMGHLFKFLVPKLETIIKEDQTFIISDIKQTMHDHLTWLLKGAFKVFLNLTQTVDIDSFMKAINNSKNAFSLSETNINFEEENQLKSLTIVVHFDSSLVTFADGTSLTGQKIRYEFVIERTNSKAKFDFTKYTKTLI